MSFGLINMRGIGRFRGLDRIFIVTAVVLVPALRKFPKPRPRARGQRQSSLRDLDVWRSHAALKPWATGGRCSGA